MKHIFQDQVQCLIPGVGISQNKRRVWGKGHKEKKKKKENQKRIKEQNQEKQKKRNIKV